MVFHDIFLQHSSFFKTLEWLKEKYHLQSTTFSSLELQNIYNFYQDAHDLMLFIEQYVDSLNIKDLVTLELQEVLTYIEQLPSVSSQATFIKDNLMSC